MWVVYCEQTGVEHNERFEYKAEADAARRILEADDMYGFTYAMRLEA